MFFLSLLLEGESFAQSTDSVRAAADAAVKVFFLGHSKD